VVQARLLLPPLQLLLLQLLLLQLLLLLVMTRQQQAVLGLASVSAG
jgi:hypothetical protein